MAIILKMKSAELVFLCILIFFSVDIYAFPKTDADFARLPAYCSARYQRPGSNPEKWKRILGSKNWIHIHHYCSGLDNLNKANSMSGPPDKITSALKNGISGIDYVLQYAQPNFILLPELHLKKGQALVRLDRYGEALAEYRLAIRIKPNYTPAYASMSDLYKKMGDRNKAIEILNKGLKQRPKSKSLKRKLNKLVSN